MSPAASCRSVVSIRACSRSWLTAADCCSGSAAMTASASAMPSAAAARLPSTRCSCATNSRQTACKAPAADFKLTTGSGLQWWRVTNIKPVCRCCTAKPCHPVRLCSMSFGPTAYCDATGAACGDSDNCCITSTPALRDPHMPRRRWHPRRRSAAPHRCCRPSCARPPAGATGAAALPPATPCAHGQAPSVDL